MQNHGMIFLVTIAAITSWIFSKVRDAVFFRYSPRFFFACAFFDCARCAFEIYLINSQVPVNIRIGSCAGIHSNVRSVALSRWADST
jgi:hypothetical protein